MTVWSHPGLRFWTLASLCIVLFACGKRSADQPASEQLSDTTEIARINAAISAHPEIAENYARRARYHQAEGNYGDAIQDMAQAMQRDSVNESYHFLLADLYMASSKSQFAIGTMDRAALLFPDSIATWNKVAELNLIVRQYDRASTALRNAMAIDPQNLRSLHLLGILLQEQDNTERAIQTYRTIVELNSEDTEAWIALGNLLDAKGDPMALQCFENAIATARDQPEGWHAKAFYLQNHGKEDEAIRIYKDIHELDNTYLPAWLNQGILYLEKDSAGVALECFETLLGIEGNSALGLFYAGSACEALGRTAEAKQYYERALALAPGSPRIQEKLEGLKQ